MGKRFPAIPAAGELVWEWFMDLDAGRQSGMQANPISWSEIKAWQELTGHSPSGWQLSAIRAMDNARLEWLAKPTNEAPASGLGTELSARSKRAT
jgi:hypothetical protein